MFNVGRNIIAVDVGTSARDRLVARQHLERRRLSGAVDAEQPETLSALDAQRQAAHGVEAAVELGELEQHHAVAALQVVQVGAEHATLLAPDVIVERVFVSAATLRAAVHVIK